MTRVATLLDISKRKATLRRKRKKTMRKTLKRWTKMKKKSIM